VRQHVASIMAIFLILVTVFSLMGEGAIGGLSDTTNVSPRSLRTSVTTESLDWSMFRHDPAHTAYANSSAPLTSQILWTFITAQSHSSPVIANGIAYVGSGDGNLYALNALTGAKIWTYAPTGGLDLWMNPAVSNGIVYLYAGDGNVYALDASTGAKIWQALGGQVSVVVNGVVYAGLSSIFALNATTGAKIWQATYGSLSSKPAFANGIIYFGTNDNNIYALNATTGAKIWNYTAGSWVLSSPAIVNGVVYVGSHDNSVYALDANTGSRIWTYKTGSSVSSSPAIADGVVYIGSQDFNVYALNAANGQKI
jgi:eukaryotic-like serine/threonine-protein kinase